MRRELEDLLYGRYPKLYRHRDKSSMCWGFTCGDGWFGIIDALSSTITSIDSGCQAVQVKEKLASLRYFFQSTHRDDVRLSVDVAESYSTRVCQITGWPGEIMVTPEGWYATLSPEGLAQMKLEESDSLQTYHSIPPNDIYRPPSLPVSERRGYSKAQAGKILHVRHKLPLHAAEIGIPPRMFDLTDVCILHISSPDLNMGENGPVVKISDVRWLSDVGLKIEVDETSLPAVAQARLDGQIADNIKYKRKRRVVRPLDEEIARLRREISAVQLFARNMSRNIDTRTGRIGPVDNEGRLIT
jgi:hypothetical protein